MPLLAARHCHILWYMVCGSTYMLRSLWLTSSWSPFWHNPHKTFFTPKLTQWQGLLTFFSSLWLTQSRQDLIATWHNHWFVPTRLDLLQTCDVHPGRRLHPCWLEEVLPWCSRSAPTECPQIPLPGPDLDSGQEIQKPLLHQNGLAKNGRHHTANCSSNNTIFLVSWMSVMNLN